MRAWREDGLPPDVIDRILTVQRMPNYLTNIDGPTLPGSWLGGEVPPTRVRVSRPRGPFGRIRHQILSILLFRKPVGA